MHKFNKLKSWKSLNNYLKNNSTKTLNDFFIGDKNRFKNFSIESDGLLFDYSKNHIDSVILDYFKEMFNEININHKIKSLFNGDKINLTEKRAVLHPLLRGSYNDHTKKLYENHIKKSLYNIKLFSHKINSGLLKGYSGKKIRNIVNVGIGGSDLGPKMVCSALDYYSNKNLNVEFISNIDPTASSNILNRLNHEETIFLISSKSFGTIETIKNGEVCKKWFLNYSKEQETIKKHFFAITSNKEKANDFGIDNNNIFELWEWVGGRYSLWSSVGLPIAIKIGYDNFNKMLDGANDIDKHFINKPFEKNIPFILASIGILYNNFYGCETQAVFPYDEYLKYFPSYLQQLDMESNGKRTLKNSTISDHQTGPIIWGDIGTNGQHAFFQLIHQGTKIIPCDFIGFINSLNPKDNLHELLISNLIGQSRALMKGKNEDELKDELSYTEESSEKNLLIKSKSFEGNRPSNTFLFQKLDPYNLGKLIAIYEHKIFLQGCIWNINSFDQWGVELGKSISNKVYDNIKSKKSNNMDLSSEGLIKFYNKTKS